jgi:polyhydroxybutyrate depolymerase
MGELTTSNKNSNNTHGLSSGTTNLKFMIAGKGLRVFRSYFIHVPPSYDGLKPVPLVIVNFCPDFNYRYPLSYFNIKPTEKYFGFSQKADEQGFIVVYPRGKLTLFCAPGYSYDKKWELWPGYSFDFGYYPNLILLPIDDIGFISDLIDKMKEDYNINSSRIYATGLSWSAMFTYSIGAYLSDKVAAIASVAGSIGCRWRDSDPVMYYIPTPENPVSVLEIHGTKDESLPWNGYFYTPSVNETISFWVEHNGCDPIPEILTSASGHIIRSTYTKGENGTEVVLYKIVGGTHTWPPYDDPYSAEISATDLICEFFAAHPKQ